MSADIKRYGFVLVLFLALSGCTRDSNLPDEPKARLKDYISKSFSVRGPEDKAVLSAYLAGDAKTRLAAWSDEQFRQAFMDAKRQFIKLVILETKQINPDQVEITYDITYLDEGKGHDAKVTNRKLCEMKHQDGKWLISEVKNIKELVEYRNEMSVSPVGK